MSGLNVPNYFKDFLWLTHPLSRCAAVSVYGSVFFSSFLSGEILR